LIKVKKNVKFNLFLLSFVAVSCLLRFCCTSGEVFAPWLDISHKTKNRASKKPKKKIKGEKIQMKKRLQDFMLLFSQFVAPAQPSAI